MRHLRCLVLFLLAVLFLGIINVTHAAEPPKTVRVGAYNNKPKIYKDDNDKAAGVFADIINYIAKRENWNVEYVFGQWDTDLERLKNGQIDIMVDVAISPEREKEFDFTKETILNSWGVIYVRKDASIDSLTDLKGKKISIQKSSVYEKGQESISQYLESFGIKADIIEVDNYRMALDLLELGKVDAAVVGHIFGLANEKNYSNIKATQIFLKPTELRFALTKGNPNNPYLIDRLDYWVSRLKSGKDDNYFRDTIEKYGLGELLSQGREETNQPEVSLPFPVLKTTLGTLAVLLTLTLIIVIILKRNWKKGR